MRYSIDEKRRLLKIAGWRRTDRGNTELWTPTDQNKWGYDYSVMLPTAWKRYLKSVQIITQSN